MHRHVVAGMLAVGLAAGSASPATVFHLVTNKDGTVALQVKSTGRYVTSHQGKAPLSADSTTVGTAESFRLVTG